jgi:hypothetical protein
LGIPINPTFSISKFKVVFLAGVAVWAFLKALEMSLEHSRRLEFEAQLKSPEYSKFENERSDSIQKLNFKYCRNEGIHI